jgi:hypothetical protein
MHCCNTRLFGGDLSEELWRRDKGRGVRNRTHRDPFWNTHRNMCRLQAPA